MFKPTNKELREIKMRPKQSVDVTTRQMGFDWISDETWAVKRAAIIKQLPCIEPLDVDFNMFAKTPTEFMDNFCHGFVKASNEAHMVLLYLEQPVYEYEQVNVNDKTKDDRRLVKLTAASPNKNSVFLNADKVLLLQSLMQTKEAQLSFWQEADKSTAPIFIQRQDRVVGFIMAANPALKERTIKAQNKRYIAAAKRAVS